MKIYLKLFLVLSMMALTISSAHAMSCKELFNLAALNRDQVIELAKKFRGFQRFWSYDSDFTPQELAWIESELDSLVARLENKTEKTYRVHGKNTNGVIKNVDLIWQDLQQAQTQVKSDHKLPQNYRVNDWLLHRLIRISDEKLEAIKTVQSYQDLEAFFKKSLWTAQVSKYDDVVEFSNNGYTPSIRLAIGQNLSEIEIEKIYTAVRAGRPFSSTRADLLSVREIKDSTNLEPLFAAGFKSERNERLDIEVFVNTNSKAKIILPLRQFGSTAIVFSERDQEGFLNATLFGVDYIHSSVRKRMTYLGKPLDEELAVLETAIHIGEVQRTLERMGWKHSYQDGRVRLTNPIAKNFVSFPKTETYPSIAPEVRDRLVRAITNQQNFSVP